MEETLRAIHLEIAESTRAARPLCVASGRCCRFEAFGHRLYVTALEAAWVLERLETELGRRLTAEEIEKATAEGTCPFLCDGRCSVHAIRPFACRTFFCDPRSEDWQRDLHERCHAAVRLLHERNAIPYRYGEWREVLAMLVAGRGSQGRPLSPGDLDEGAG